MERRPERPIGPLLQKRDHEHEHDYEEEERSLVRNGSP
jgi:hypothetical protein